MSTELVIAGSPEEIAALPAGQRGEIITHALIESRQWLAVATKGTDPTPIAEFKAWAATVAEMTKQKGLAAEIQADALEMVRRAERGIGLVVRNGQEAGEIRRRCEHEGNQHGTGLLLREKKTSPTEFFSGGQTITDTYAMTDGVTDEVFEGAIHEARSEGNLSRANVIRKVQGIKADAMSPVERLRQIRVLAPTGMTSQQISREVGVGEQYVRKVARVNDIDIPADRVMRNTRRLDHTRFVNETVLALEGLASGLDVLDLAKVDPTQIVGWSDSLTTSLRALNRMAKDIKEMTP